MAIDSPSKKRYLLLLPLIWLLLLTGCAAPGEASAPLEATGFYFDTVISIRIYGQHPQEILNRCMELAGEYENLLSPYIEGSDLWNINHSNGSFVTVDEDTLKLINTALSYARLSDGLVDPTVGGLSRLWNFGSDNQKVIPDQSAIGNAMAHVDYHSVIIDGNQVRLTDPQAQLDLGFIAKGFIGDRLKEYLISEDVHSALIYLGGNVVVLGDKPEGTPFRIGIQDPFAENGASLLTLELSDMSIVSSGNYERFFELDGKRYHHILSTSTGYPTESGLAQVTILSPASTDGDALSTLCFILGYEKAASLLENYPDIRAVFVTEDGNILYANFD